MEFHRGAGRAEGVGGREGAHKALVRSKAHPIAELQTEQELRFSTGMGELDRVLGGGAVKGLAGARRRRAGHRANRR